MVDAFKREEDLQNRREMEDVIVDYKLGMMDPRRAVAGFEKSSLVKKKKQK